MPGFERVALVDEFRRCLTSGNASLLTLLELLMAFNITDHFIGGGGGLVCQKWTYGTILWWLHSFLDGRPQKDLLEETHSASWPFT